MKQILLMIAVVALVGCGKKPAEESVFNQGRPDATKPSKPPAKTEAQIEPENKELAETKAKAEAGFANAQNNLGVMYGMGQGMEQDYVTLMLGQALLLPTGRKLLRDLNLNFSNRK